MKSIWLVKSTDELSSVALRYKQALSYSQAFQMCFKIRRSVYKWSELKNQCKRLAQFFEYMLGKLGAQYSNSYESINL